MSDILETPELKRETILSYSHEVLKFKPVGWNKDCPFKAPKLGDVGYDLYSAVDVEIKAQSLGKVDSGIQLEFPAGYWGKIEDRSSVSTGKFYNGACLKTHAGIIDTKYRGNVIVALFNHSNKSVLIKKGDKIAQLILHQVSVFNTLSVKKLSETDRGDKGFGSSGLK